MSTAEPPTTTGASLKLPVSNWERLSHLLPWLVLTIGLAVTYGLWNASRDITEREAREYFDFRVRDVLDKTQQRLMVYEQILRGAQGLFKASDSVSRTAFKNYISTLRLADNYPGTQGVGFSQVIPPDELEHHITAIQNEGFPEYTIRPEGERDLYTSIIYLEPFAERNLRAFGYDMYSEPVRRAAMERARDTGLAAMSGKVLLVQEAKQDIQSGFLIYLPVYRNDAPHATLAQRRDNLIGWVYSPFRIADLMRGIYGERALDLHIHIYDGTTISEQSMMYDASLPSTDDTQTVPRFYASQQLEIAGHPWTIEIASRPSFELRIDTTTPAWVAASGIAASLVLTLTLWILVSSRRRAIMYARQMNQELIASEQALRDSETKLQGILDSAAVAIAWANAEGEIKYANREFQELFGYTLADVSTVAEWYRRAYPNPAYRNSVVTKWEADIAAARQQGTTIPPIELAITCKDGSIRHTVLTSAWVGTDILASFSDITERKQTEEKLQRWANIFEFAEWGIIIGSTDGKRIELANPAFARSHGYTTDELQQLSIAELFAPNARAELPKHIQTAHEKGHHTFESVHIRKDGSTFPVLVDVTTVKDAEGQVLYSIANVQDITDRKQAEKALQDSKTILQAILDNLPYQVWMKDGAGRFIVINKLFLASTGKQLAEDVLGKSDNDLWPRPLAEKYLRDDETVIALRRQLTLEEQALDDDRLIWTETFKSPVLDENNQLLGITGFARDITERKLDELRVRHQAHHDALTELPNRTLFSDRLQQALVHARRSKEHLAVLFLDLDQFKPVNDMFGHDVGDMLLKEVAHRLRACVRESDTVARIGGDEFCILLSSVESEQNVSMVAEKILHTLRQPFVLQENHITIAASIGIAIYPQDGKDEESLIKNADIAMYWAKETGRNNIKFFIGAEMRQANVPHPVDQD